MRWPPLRRPREAIGEVGEAEPSEPGFRLGKRLAALHAAEGETERDIVPRGFPRQQRVILEQDAELRAG